MLKVKLILYWSNSFSEGRGKKLSAVIQKLDLGIVIYVADRFLTWIFHSVHVSFH